MWHEGQVGALVDSATGQFAQRLLKLKFIEGHIQDTFDWECAFQGFRLK